MSVKSYISPSLRFKVEVTIDTTYKWSFSALCSMAIEKLNRAIVSEQYRDYVCIKEVSPPLV